MNYSLFFRWFSWPLQGASALIVPPSPDDDLCDPRIHHDIRYTGALRDDVSTARVV
jgi:hypothetical protein